MSLGVRFAKSSLISRLELSVAASVEWSGVAHPHASPVQQSSTQRDELSVES